TNINTTPAPPLGTLISSLRTIDLDGTSDELSKDAKITGTRDIASFNWMNEDDASIIVPGKPPLWTPLRWSRKLMQDSGNYFRDLNAARYPKHPMEPAVEAILISEPKFPIASVDVFACGSTLGNLLRFASGTSEKSFRILVEAVGNTVFFIRRENSPKELIQGVVGFGHSFPEAYTTWDPDVKGSDSHQRIVQYDFSGLSCIVRLEGDGYYKDMVSDAKNLSTSAPGSSPGTDVPLEDLFQSSLNTRTENSASSSQSNALQVRAGGHQIPHSAVFDLKTRSIRRANDDNISPELPRLWIRQIQNFLLAYHAHGVFNDIQKIDVRDKIEQWEEDNQIHLRRLKELLKKIIAAVRERKDGKLEIVKGEGGLLELREQGGTSNDVLSPSVRARW
ncbi:hypothetical protein M501DRAFT_906486, partial [Patellaria atrata CBS 101060]